MTPEPTESSSSPAFNPDGSFSDGWPGALGDEFASHAAQLSTFKDVKGLAKSYLHLRAHGPAYPDEQASDEDIARFRTLARVPEEGTAEAYGLTIPENASDADKAIYDKMAALAQKHHLPAPGFAALVEEYSAMQQEQVQAYLDQQQRAFREAQDDLIAHWRGDFESNCSTVRHYTERLALSAGVSVEDPAIQSLANNPAFARMMMEVAKLTSEDRVRAPGGFGDLRSPRQQAEEIMSGRDPVWGERYRAGDRGAMEHVSAILQKVR